MYILGIPSSGWAPSVRTFRMWEMEDERGCISSLSGYSVLNGERERRGGGWRGGRGRPLPGGPGKPRLGTGRGRVRKRVGRAEHVSHHLRAVEFPLFWGEACEDAVGLRLVGDE